MLGQNGAVDRSQSSTTNTMTPKLIRKTQGLSIGSNTSTSSQRSSIASSNTSRYTTSGMTATSAFSSIDEHDQASTNSSAIGFLNDSVDDQDFGLIDTLDYEDVDEGIIGKFFFFCLFCAGLTLILLLSQTTSMSIGTEKISFRVSWPLNKLTWNLLSL